MLLHRFDTVLHILAATGLLDLFQSARHGRKSSQTSEIISQYGLSTEKLEINQVIDNVKAMQAFRNTTPEHQAAGNFPRKNEEFLGLSGNIQKPVSRRHVVQNVERNVRNRTGKNGHRYPVTLDAAFQRRFLKISQNFSS